MRADFHSILDKLTAWLMTGGVRVATILIGMFLAMWIFRAIFSRILATVVKKDTDTETLKRFNTLKSIFRNTTNIFILGIGIMLILKEFAVDLGPILAAAGVIGLAVGFGAQSLVRDVITGFFILLEDQIRVGDVVQVAEKSGLVEKISLRTTILRDLAGNVHYVRNGEIATVTNMTKEYSRYVFDVGVAYREDVDEVMNVLREIDEELRQDDNFKDAILEPLEILGLDQFADSAIIIKARIKTKPIEQWRVGREFNRRMKKRFDERNIEIPFPHITLYMGADKLGQAAPMSVKLENTGGNKSTDRLIE